MKIFIKVEFFQNSKYLQHLLEHTIWGKLRKIDAFFDLFLESDLHTFNSYILWEIPNYCDLETFKQAIFSEPNLKIFNYEKKVLKDELLKTSFKLKIEQKIWKTSLRSSETKRGHLDKDVTYFLMNYSGDPSALKITDGEWYVGIYKWASIQEVLGLLYYGDIRELIRKAHLLHQGVETSKINEKNK